MGYKDMFGENFFTPKSEEDEAATPTAFNQGSHPETAEPLLFKGFSSGLPLLVERPSRYINRLRRAALNLYKVPDDDQYGGMDARILYSPVISLPVFLMQGNELYPNESTVQYPLLHYPVNHAPDHIRDVSVYMLTLVALYSSMGLMREDEEGDLLCYGLSDPFTCDDDMWMAAEDWAKDTAPLLRDLNMARLLGFALNDRDNEIGPLSALYETWNEKRSADTIMDAGKKAADLLQPEYSVFLEAEFRPFQER